jgi:uncharacterized GH25 family protein
MMHKTIFSYLLPILMSATPSYSHEVWIEPLQWSAAPGEEIKAHIFNGELLSGYELIWDDRRIVRAEAWQNQTRKHLQGRLGDRPALSTAGQDNGLLTLLYQSTYSTVDYDSYEKFAAFAEEKGHLWALEQHDARRLSRTAIKEAYTRFAKSLVKVGSGDGADAFRGMELELVALDNPYVSRAAEALTVQLVYQNETLADHRVTVFERTPQGEVSLTVLQTDQDGKAGFKVTPGADYLVDAVVLREPARSVVIETRGAVWESLWASLTFTVPANQ